MKGSKRKRINDQFSKKQQIWGLKHITRYQEETRSTSVQPGYEIKILHPSEPNSRENIDSLLEKFQSRNAH